MQKGFAPIIVLAGVLVMIGVIGGAFYVGKTTLKPTPPQNPIVSGTLKSSPASSTSPAPIGVDETASWKTYTNQNFLFSFKYPDVIFKYISNETEDQNNLDFVLLEQPEERISNLRLYITVSKSDPALERTVVSIFHDDTDPHDVEKKTIQVNDVDGYFYYHNPVVRGNSSLGEVPAVYGYKVFFKKGDILYQIELTTEKSEEYLKQNEVLFKQILASFRLL